MPVHNFAHNTKQYIASIRPLKALLTLILMSTLIGACSTDTPSSTPQQGQQQPAKQIIGYLEHWGVYKNVFAKDLLINETASKLTVINYAFGNVGKGLKCDIEDRPGWGDPWADFQRPFSASESVNGLPDQPNQTLRGNFNQLKQLKARYPHLKILITLGGWTWSGRFSDAALVRNRTAFVQSCINLYLKGNLPILPNDKTVGGPGVAAGIFDGIDIDWEYPGQPGYDGNPAQDVSPNIYRDDDPENYVALMAEFRRQMDILGQQTNKRYLLTATTPAASENYSRLDLYSLGLHADWLNVMTYDMHGPWENTGPTNFHAPLRTSPKDPSPEKMSVDDTIRSYLSTGLPPGKIMMGIPFYGHGWTNVPNINRGLYQRQLTMEPAPGTDELGSELYRVLKNLPNYKEYRDPTTGAFWIFNGTTFWTYDDPVVIVEKMQYIKQLNLGGVMIWSLRGDDGTLMQTIHDNLRE